MLSQRLSVSNGILGNHPSIQGFYFSVLTRELIQSPSPPDLYTSTKSQLIATFKARGLGEIGGVPRRPRVYGSTDKALNVQERESTTVSANPMDFPSVTTAWRIRQYTVGIAETSTQHVLEYLLEIGNCIRSDAYPPAVSCM